MAKIDGKALLKGVAKWAVPIGMGIVAVVNAVSEQKQQERFDNLEKIVTDLQNK